MRGTGTTRRLIALAAIGLLGCGRVGFAPLGDGERDAAADASLGSGLPDGATGVISDAVPAELPRDGLVGYWAFDEGAGDRSADLSGHGRDAQLVNMEPEDWVAGVRGTALDFAIDDYVRYGCAGTGCPVPTYAVSFWFNADALSGALFSYFGGETYTSPSHKTIAFSGAYLHVGRSELRRGVDMTRFTPGVWHHVVVNYQDTTAITVFLDGVDVTVTTNDYWNSGAFSLGRRVDDYSAMQFDGRIDEVALYDRVLTPADIASLHAIGL